MRTFLILLGLSFLFPSFLSAQCNDPGTPTPGIGPNGCQEAPLLCSISELDGYSNCTGVTGVGPCPAGFCGTCENYQWFSFVATTPSLELEITPVTCEETPTGVGLQAVIYQTPDCFNFFQVSNCESPSVQAILNVSASNLELGSLYYLMIDGWAGDICEYEIQVLEGGDPVAQGASIDSITGATLPCIAAEPWTYFAHTTPAPAIVNWSVNPNLGTVESGQGTNQVSIAWTTAGVAELCATTTTPCGSGEEVCTMVTVEQVPPVFQYHEACLGDTVYCGGEAIFSPGSYLAGDTILPDGCVADLVCVVELYPPSYVFLGDILLCEGECFEGGDSLFCDPGGSYAFTTTGQNGCDSIVVFELETLHPSVAIGVSSSAFCEPPVELQADTNVIASDTAVWVGEVFWEGPGIVGDSTGLSILVDSAGIYIASFEVTQLGQSCSVQDTFLVEFQGASTDSLDVRICEGDTIWVGPSAYAEPGTYIDTLSSSVGCDSIVVLELSIDSVLYAELSETICEGDSLLFGGSFLSEAGLYADTLMTSLGCDSIVTLELMLASPVSDSLLVQLCEGESVQVGDSLLADAGIYELLLTSQAGCDSLVLVEVEVFPSFETEQIVDLCFGDTLVVGNSIYTETGVYEDTLLALNGCDSIVTTILQVSIPVVESYQFELCAGDSIDLNGVVYTAPGSYQDTAIGTNGCDSVYYSISLDQGWQLLEVEEWICEGDTFVLNNEYYTKAGVYQDTLPGVPGACGDIVTLTLGVWQTESYYFQDTLCYAQTIDWQGLEISEPGQYFVLEPNGPFGCQDTFWLEVLGNPDIEMTSYEITPNYQTQTGSIFPEWSGGTPPYLFEWSNGAQTSFVENVPFGNYLVTVIDSYNCFQSWGFQLGGVIGDPGIQAASRPLTLWPNPLDEEELHLEVPEDYDGPGELELMNVQGQVVLRTEVGFAGGRGVTEVGDLPGGVYFLRLRVGTAVWTERVQVF